MIAGRTLRPRRCYASEPIRARVVGGARGHLAPGSPIALEGLAPRGPRARTGATRQGDPWGPRAEGPDDRPRRRFRACQDRVLGAAAVVSSRAEIHFACSWETNPSTRSARMRIAVGRSMYGPAWPRYRYRSCLSASHVERYPIQF